MAADALERYSAGTDRKDHIKPDAVLLMNELYHIDMEAKGQHGKLPSNLPTVDIAVTMGRNVQCSFLSCKRREDWDMDDPN